MQQQYAAQQDQYGNQQQMAQQMVLCPIQYVYETPMLVQPSIQEEQVQPQPYLLNVQNPPPWINRQNVVYLQQHLPIYPNMVQNQIYHQQVNYLPQMVVPHEIRQIQMPIHTPEPEKTPVLTQMLKNQIQRPIMQNQQVQTDISSRPTRPQVITINPMQQRFQKDPRPRQDIPNHIRTKLPSSISVKTIYRPILPRPIRPYENFYYNNFVVPEPINTDFAQTVQNVKPEKKFKNEESQTISQTVNKVNNEQDKVKFNQINARLNPEVNKAESKADRPAPVAMETQTEEKLLRGTVFVQARGRVLEKDVVINSLKRTLDDRLQMNMAKNQINNVNNNINTAESPKKYIKVEAPQTLQINNAKTHIPIEQNQMTVPQNINQIPEEKVIKTINTELITNTELTAKATELNNLKTQLSNIEQKETKYKITEKNIDISKEIMKPDEIRIPKVKEQKKEVPKPRNICNEEVNIKDRLKEEKVVVLTHVLDGHIIQESNVAFPIQKLSKESENDKTSQKVSPKSVDIEKHDVIPHLPLSYEHLTKNMEDAESTDIDKDSPFGNVKKSAVRSWTTEQLADQLAKHDKWKETASKLLDQEIDGESLLLVNKDQLVIIGVCETHAEIIEAFVSKN